MIHLRGWSLRDGEGVYLCRLQLLTTWAVSSQQMRGEKLLLEDRSCGKPRISTRDEQGVDFSRARSSPTHLSGPWPRVTWLLHRTSAMHTLWTLGNPFFPRVSVSLSVKRGAWSTMWFFLYVSTTSEERERGPLGNNNKHTQFWTLLLCFKMHGCSMSYTMVYLYLFWY